jgi:hypothetical protein
VTDTLLEIGRDIAAMNDALDQVAAMLGDQPARRARGLSGVAAAPAETDDAVDGFYMCGGLLEKAVDYALVETAAYVNSSWVSKHDLPPPGRFDHACAVVDRLMYSFAGAGTFGFHGHTDELNPLGHGTWTRRAPWTYNGYPWTDPDRTTNTRHGHGAAPFDSVVYVTGGRRDTDNEVYIRNDEYSPPPLDLWTSKSPISPYRMRHASTATADGVYLTGSYMNRRDAVELYIPSSDSYVQKADLPTWLWEHAATTVNGAMYVAAGKLAGSTYNNKTYGYDSGGDSWDTLTDMPAPSRADFAYGTVNTTSEEVGELMVVQGGEWAKPNSIYDGHVADMTWFAPAIGTFGAWGSNIKAPSPPRQANKGAGIL